SSSGRSSFRRGGRLPRSSPRKTGRPAPAPPRRDVGLEGNRAATKDHSSASASLEKEKGALGALPGNGYSKPLAFIHLSKAHASSIMVWQMTLNAAASRPEASAT